MNLDYNKLKNEQSGSSNQWASYSDLFMLLSFIFLLLYVTTSLRNGTKSIQKNIEYKKLVQQTESLKQQLRAYETLKQDYVDKKATSKERDDYADLMEHLKLLQIEAKEEKEALRSQASANEQKEKSLNQYQQMIRNIVNANMVARARIDKRNKVIIKKNATIKEKQQEVREKVREIAGQQKQILGMEKKVKGLERTVETKQNQIAFNQKKISKIKSKMDSEIEKLNKAYQEQKVSRKIAYAKITQLRRESAEKVNRLQGKTKLVESQLNRINQKLSVAQQQISKASQQLAEKDQEKILIQQKFKAEAMKMQETYKQRMASIDEKYTSKISAAKVKYEKELKKQNSKYHRKSKKLRKQAKRRLKAAQAEYQRLQAEAKSAKKTYADEVKTAKVALQQIKKSHKDKVYEMNSKHIQQLAKERAKANARKVLIKQIKNNFAKAGIKANVDEKSGDVIIAFGDEYFETGKFGLKKGMVDILHKFVPAYSKSLFENKEVADKINGVEIIGFASPTYKGKYVDPTSLKPKDRAAVSYNLDLSYRRAKSIFSHIFDTRKLTYQHQKRLLSLVKVTGRSFLANKERGIATNVVGKKCATKNCKESQKVIIKFNLKN